MVMSDVVGIDFYNQSLTGDVAKSLNSIATDSDHVPCVMTYGLITKGNGEVILTEEKHMSLSTGGGQAGQGFPCVYINGRVSGGFLNRNSSEARTIGFEWEMSPTLRESVIPSVIVLNDQGGAVMDVSYEVTATLRAQDHGHPPLIYDARGNGGGDICPTITGDHQNRITDYTAVVLQRSDSSNGSQTK